MSSSSLAWSLLLCLPVLTVGNTTNISLNELPSETIVPADVLQRVKSDWKEKISGPPLPIFLGYAPVNSTSCENFSQEEQFRMLTTFVCPAVKDSEACIDSLFEMHVHRRFNCRQHINASAIVDMPYHLSTNKLQQLLRMKNNHSHFCVCAIFFSPYCPFSARYFTSFRQLPPLFPNILFVAVNASDPLSSRFNSRYGVSGTPTVMLWVDGLAVARVDETKPASTGLVEFLTELTDSMVYRPLMEDDRPAWEAKLGTFTLFLLACIGALCSTYYNLGNGPRKWQPLHRVEARRPAIQ